MTDNRNDETGQFESEAPRFGQEGVLHDAGYKPMPRNKKESEAVDLTVEEALEAMPPRNDGTIVIDYETPDGEKISRNTALSIDQVAEDLSDFRASAIDNMAELQGENLAKAVDDARAELLKNDPTAAERFGIEKPADAENTTSDDEAIEPTATAEQPTDLEAVLKRPEIAEAISRRVAEVDAATTELKNSVNLAKQFAQASLIEQFPEFAGMTVDQLPAALQLTRQQDPQKFQRVCNILNRVAQLQGAQEKLTARDDENTKRVFSNWAKDEDNKFDAMVESIPHEMKVEIRNEIMNGVRDAGILPQNFLQMYQEQPIMRHAAFQKMMFDAARWRIAQRAATNIRPSPRSTPPVQRPGVGGAMRNTSDSVSAAEAQFSRSGSIDDAFKFLQARRGSRR